MIRQKRLRLRRTPHIQAMDKVYALVIATGALAFVSSLFVKREKLFIKAVACG